MFVINDTIKKVMKAGACCSVPDGKFPLSSCTINIYGELIAPALLTPRTRPLEPSNYVCCTLQWKRLSVSDRLAKIDLVTIFDCDYRWYCTIDYVIVNYIWIHHLFYHIQ